MADEQRSDRRTAAWWLVRWILLGIAAVMAWFLITDPHNHSSGSSSRITKDAADRNKLQQQTPLPGELILKNFGSPSGRPEGDLSMLANALSNLTLLIKAADPFPMGSNEEFAAALRGKNRTRLRFLPDVHRAFNAQDQLVDRWTTPLFFHAVAHDRIDIRSAGPDRQMWTEDDLHRKYDGQFLRGKDLNPRSLFDSGRPGSAAR
jgi:hypothetical protein